MDLLTIRETAQLLKVNPITVRRYIAAGRLPAVRVGRAIRVRREALDALITPVEPTASRPQKRAAPVPRGKPFTRDDSLFNIVGIADGPGDGVRDVSENKYKYLAEAYADTHE